MFGKTAQSIQINRDHSRDLIGERVEASGWGALYFGGSTSNQLFAVQMPVIPRSQSNYTQSETYDNELMLIAGQPGGEAPWIYVF